MAIRFLIDEQIPRALARAILRHNQKGIYPIDAVKVGDPGAPAFGTRDPALLQWAEQEGRILISYDKKTLPVHFAMHLNAGRHVPGIFLFKSRHTLPFMVEFLATVSHASVAGEWVDRIVVAE